MSKIVGNRLKMLRNVKRLSQVEFAKYLGVHVGTYPRWEQGKCLPDTESIIKIADKCEINIDWLLGRTSQLKLTIEKIEDIQKYCSIQEGEKTS